MDGKTRLGIYLHNTYLGNGKFTVTNYDSLTFIERLGLAERTALAVSVLATPDINPDDYSVVVEQRGINLISLPGWKNLVESLPSMLFSFGKLLRKARSLVENSDIVWMRIPSLVALLFWWVAKKTRKPLVIHVVGNSLLAPRRPDYQGLLKIPAYMLSYMLHFLTRLMGRYGIVLTAGGELQQILSTFLHPACQLYDSVIYERELRPAKKTSEAKDILFVGRFDHGKGVKVLIDSIGILKEEFPDICFRMAGDGPLLNAVRNQVTAQGLERNVKLLGFVSSSGPLQELYKNADIFVMPSDIYEGFPRVILEAWAAGLPLVATRLGGIPYKVINEENGLLVTPGDRGELTGALRRLIQDTDLRYRIACGGTQTVSRLTFEHQAHLIKTLLKRHYPHLDLNPCNEIE